MTSMIYFHSFWLIGLAVVASATDRPWPGYDNQGQTVLKSQSAGENCLRAVRPLAPTILHSDVESLGITNIVTKCTTLRETFNGQLVFPDEGYYKQELLGYWSLQQSLTRPACIFLPLTSQDVSTVLKVSHELQCPFAAKSGGHAAFAGSSNIAGGITIDLAGMNDITMNRDRSTVYVGPGNKWVDVYRYLEPENLVVIGGRVAPIGIGGLTLGGGISYFSNAHGFACDNVASYEVVTATGDVITASPDDNQDLYWALRGGGNNFGLVTRFELVSYPLDHRAMWFGKLTHPGVQNSSLIRAFFNYAREGSQVDMDSTILFSFVYVQSQDQNIIVTEVEYPEQVEEGSYPAVYSAFFDVPNALRVISTTKSLSQIAQDHSDANPNGKRQAYWTATFRLDLQLIHEIVNIWHEEIEPIKKTIAGFVPVMTLQVITVSMLEQMSRNGGNALGLQDEEAPLLTFVPSAMWADAADDDAIHAAYGNWLQRATEAARSRGLDHPYLYMNYASQFQDPIASYGKKNAQRLRDVAQKYDPEAFFQKLQPGYFKL